MNDVGDLFDSVADRPATRSAIAGLGEIFEMGEHTGDDRLAELVLVTTIGVVTMAQALQVRGGETLPMVAGIASEPVTDEAAAELLGSVTGLQRVVAATANQLARGLTGDELDVLRMVLVKTRWACFER